MLNVIIPALIALVGVIISVTVSFITAIHRSRLEIQKFRTEIQQHYVGKLFEKRLEVYPELFTAMSSTVQQINFLTISAAQIKDLFMKAQEWEANNTIFLSAFSQQVSYKLVRMLHEWSEMSDEQLVIKLRDSGQKAELKKHLQEMELALKNDLGIYALDSPSTITDFKAPTSYKEVKQYSQKGH